MIQEQIRKAKREGRDATAEEEEDIEDIEGTEGEGFKRKDGEKIVLSFGAKKSLPEATQPPTPPLSDKDETSSDKDKETSTPSPSESTPAEPATAASSDPVDSKISEKKQPFSISFGASTAKPKNVFAAASKKKPLVGANKTAGPTPSRPMSEAERIMKEEIERKRQREAHGFKPGQNAFKKQRIS
jgi:DNA/RNA-binding protein KIN17